MAQGSFSKKIVCFGDSITEGYMVAETEAYPSVLSRLLGITCVNLGVSGETTFDALRRLNHLDVHLRSAKSVPVLVEFGINDFFMAIPARECEANLKNILDYMGSKGHRPVLLGFYMDYPGVSRWTILYDRLAKGCNVPLYPDIFKGLSKKEGDFLPDGLHPSASGYAKMASSICDFLLAKKLL